MPELQKATLAELDNSRGRRSRTQPRVLPGTEMEVQFNPASLKLTLKNVHDRGESESRQVRQFMGRSSDTYTLELHFDTADEGRGGEAISVREKTQMVERFLKPGGRGATPPRLRFCWGDFIIDGVVDSIDLDFDHFAANGLPLRAKATMTLKRQDSSYEVLPEGEAEAAQTQTRAGQSGGGTPGSGGDGGSSAATAQGGESPAELAARLGLDPSAWRGLDIDLDASLEAGVGLSLEAGASVGFDASLGVGVGLGVSAGFEAGATASLEASFGLSVEGSASLTAGATASFSASASASASAEVGAGFRLSASGGVEAAIELTAGFEATAAVSGSVAAFAGTAAGTSAGVRVGLSSSLGGRSRSAGVLGSGAFAAGSSFSPAGGANRQARSIPRAALPSGPSRPEQDRQPLRRTGLRGGPDQREPEPAPPPPRVDRRAISYGRGLPLNPRVRVEAVSGGRPREAGEDASSGPSLARRPSEAPWVALPRHDRARAAADEEQQKRRPATSCACTCEPELPWSIERKPKGGR